jgi:ABC-type multidrug transport system permease subunit
VLALARSWRDGGLASWKDVCSSTEMGGFSRIGITMAGFAMPPVLIA